MLNLKKGLALVLAATTIVTFAPLSTLTASAADNVTDDGLKANTGIDSIAYSEVSVPAATKASGVYTYGVSPSVYLKEHEDTSVSTAAKVGGYLITVNRLLKDNVYKDVVKVVNPTAAATLASGTSTAGFTATTGHTDEITPAGDDGNNTTTNGAMSLLNDTKLQTRQFYVDNVATVRNDTDHTISNIGGANIQFYNDNGVDGTVSVTIAAVRSKDDLRPLDSTTLKVTVANNDSSFALQSNEGYVAEGDVVEVPFVVAHKGDFVSFGYENDYDHDVVKGETSKNDANPDGVEYSGTYNLTTAYGTVKIAGYTQGVTTVKFYAQKANGDKVYSNYKIHVTPGNGKLSVTYTANTRDGYQRMTYTDDVEHRVSSANKTITYNDSNHNLETKDGAFKIYTQPKTDDEGYFEGANGKYIKATDTTTTTATGTSQADGTKSLPDLGDSARQLLVYNFVSYSVLPNAQYLTSDSNKTIQFNADSNAGAKVSYSLVAPSYVEDINNANTTTAQTEQTHTLSGALVNTNDGLKYDVYSYSKQVNRKTGTGTVSTDTHGQGGQYTKLVLTEAAAQKYGAITKDGLVTLKSTWNEDYPLYVVVTAEAKAADATHAAQKLSTYIIPIGRSELSPLQFYASDSKGFAEAEQEDIFGQATPSTMGPDKYLYLNLKSRPSDKLNVIAKVGDTVLPDSYVTGKSDDPTIATYDDSTRTVTAVKAGETNITLRSLSAPNCAGTVVAKIHVVVNDLATNNVITNITNVSVNRDKPTAKITATPLVSGTNVKFDKVLYQKDASRPSGYSRLKSTDPKYNDIEVSSTGNITYIANSGTVYVRAYAEGDSKNNPSTWAYAAVNYGQEIVDTELKVSKDPIILDVKGTKQIDATASTGASITYTSADPTVASVDANGLVTANKSGYTTVTVAANSADGKTGDSEVITVIVRGSETITDDTVKKPSKVTGVKVTNLKGGKVKVTWTKQNQKNIKYYVKKTVGKKSAGKSVGSNKTTLSVKKGAKVKVKVKAYIYDATGKKLVGSYSKTVTKKTDKK